MTTPSPLDPSITYRLPGYRPFAVAVAALATVLAGTLFFAPDTILTSFGLEPTASASFLARRAAVLFLGLAVLAVTSLDPRGLAPRPFLASVAVSMLGLAILGTAELLRGVASAGIGPAIVTEIIVGGGAVILLVLDHRRLHRRLHRREPPRPG
ncbi:MAG: hypothetical protein AAGF11_09305 [Myxococcota bacterium]